MDTESIDLLKLFKIIKNRIWLIVLAGLICFMMSFVYTFFVVDKAYSADVLLYIWQDKKASDGSSDSVTYNEMLLFAQLVNDYQVLCQSRLVTSTVATEMNMSEAEGNRLSSQISVGTKNNTRHLIITVTDTNPARAAEIANTVSTVFAQVVVDNMGAGTVKIIDPAIVPTAPSSPNVKINLAIGLLIGLAIGVGVVLLIEVLDTRVRQVADVEALTGFTPLGGIPEYDFQAMTMEGRR